MAGILGSWVLGPMLGTLDTIVAKTQSPHFFTRGWGNLHEFRQCEKYIKLLVQAPPAVDIAWSPATFVSRSGSSWVSPISSRTSGYAVRRGTFTSPAAEHISCILPRECETAVVELVTPLAPKSDVRRYAGVSTPWATSIPVNPHVDVASTDANGRLDGQRTPVVLMLTMTGDEGFEFRRTNIAAKLAERGIATLSLEYAYYGARRPEGQYKHYLGRVSDFAPMGLCTIGEGAALLRWLRESNFGVVGLTGLSQGGAYASFLGALTNEKVGIVTACGPHSASPVFVEGKIASLCDWETLAAEDNVTVEVAMNKMKGILRRYTDLENLARHTVKEQAAHYGPVTHVVASNDRYVPWHSSKRLIKYWPSARVMTVHGGHASTLAFNGNVFVDAIDDALTRMLTRGPYKQLAIRCES